MRDITRKNSWLFYETTPQEKLRDFMCLRKVERNHMVRDTLALRANDRGIQFENFISDWPFLITRDGLVAEFKAMRKIKNIDFIVNRVKRYASNFKN